MKNKTLLAGIALLFIGCAGNPHDVVQDPQIQRQVEKEPSKSEIIDYKNKASGGTVPEWVDVYHRSGITGLESLEIYEGYYVFISENSGGNFNALEQWMAGFSVRQDFSRMAAIRIEARFLRSVAAYPDDEYGGYYEAMVKTASNAYYEGALKEDEFWVKRLYYDETGKVDREIYEFYIAVSIFKPVLEYQVMNLLTNIDPDPKPSRDQIHAIDRVRNNFFNGF